MLGHDDSIKDFQVEAIDGNAGKVSWASYAPGESYLVINLRRHTSMRLTMSFPPPPSRGSAFLSGRYGMGSYGLVRPDLARMRVLSVSIVPRMPSFDH